MSRDLFFSKKSEFFTLGQIIEITGAVVSDGVDKNLKIYDIATLDKASAGEISFFSSGQYSEKFQASKAGFCFVDQSRAGKAAQGMVVLIHPNPYFAYSQTAAAFYKEKDVEFFAGALVHPSAQIGAGARIAPNAYVGKNVKIGKNCYIGPSASVMDNCVIGDNCTINAGAVISYAIIGDNCAFFNGAKIGQDGFGFAHNKGVNHKIIQLGIVEIGNDVEIGANTCIDRGAIENTKIGDGVKIDNLVQIGHNVVIGAGTVIAGSAAIAGSTKVGRFVQIGGNSSIGGHINIGDGVKIAGMSGVMRDIEPMQTVAGAPVLPIREWHRMNIKLFKMAKGED